MRMPSEAQIEHAVADLRETLELAQNPDNSVVEEISTIIAARDDVIQRYQPVFSPSTISELSAETFLGFLQFENNRHWSGLERNKNSLVKDMDSLRGVLKDLLDESNPISERIDEVLPGGKGKIPHLGKAILTAILHVAYPDKYAPMNSTSLEGHKRYGLDSVVPRGSSLGERYEILNAVSKEISRRLNIDLWILDALWWRTTKTDQDTEIQNTSSQSHAWIMVANPEKWNVEEQVVPGAVFTYRVHPNHVKRMKVDQTCYFYETGPAYKLFAQGVIRQEPALRTDESLDVIDPKTYGGEEEVAMRAVLETTKMLDPTVPYQAIKNDPILRRNAFITYGSQPNFPLSKLEELLLQDLIVNPDFGERKILVVAAERDGSLWSDFKETESALVGFDNIPDIREYDTKDEFDREFMQQATNRVQKAGVQRNQLWSFFSARPGDIVVARVGQTRIRAIGRVRAPGYYFDNSNKWPEYPHRLYVDWDTSYDTSFPPYKKFLDTIHTNVTAEELNTLLDGGFEAENESALARAEEATRVRSTQDPKNVILFGPPGTGKTYQTRKRAVEICDPTLISNTSEDEIQKRYEGLCGDHRIEFVTFHQSFGYEEFVEGIRPDVNDGSIQYILHEGIFKEIAKKAEDLFNDDNPDASEPCVLIIDEINRANISAVLGELITLLEPDKRKGGDHPLKVTLPYSKKPFMVPSNLYIIGTMNTADRSIALMDTALRRRFRFEEVMPNSDVIRNVLTEKAVEADHISMVCKIFTAMNQRIKLLLDRDHMLGHSFFLDATDLEKLRDVFRYDIIPLLEEHFYSRRELVAKVLGDSRSKDKAIYIRTDDKLDVSDQDYGETASQLFEVNEDFIKASGDKLEPYFLSILGTGDNRDPGTR